MPKGKPAGVACIHLDSKYRCLLFGDPTRPAVCANLKPCYEMCGNDRQQALQYLQQLENATAP